MNNSSPPLEIDYAKHITTQNNMEVEVNSIFLSSNQGTLSYNFSLPPSQHACVSNEVVSNSGSMNEIDISSKLSLPPLGHSI